MQIYANFGKEKNQVLHLAVVVNVRHFPQQVKRGKKGQNPKPGL
jgi:hypothetical protein